MAKKYTEVPKELGYKMSANTESWLRETNVNSIPRPQENEYTRFEYRRGLNEVPTNFTPLPSIRRENWSDGDGFRDAQPSLSNKKVCSEFLEVFNHTAGFARNQCNKLFDEYLLTLEEFNICGGCKSPIKTKKHQVNGAIRKTDKTYQSSDKTLPQGFEIGKDEKVIIVQNKGAFDYVTEIGKTAKQTMTVAYHGKNGLVKERESRKGIAYNKSAKDGVQIETAIIPQHYEIELYVNRERIDFSRRNFVNNLFNRKARVKFVLVAEKISNKPQCNCFQKEERKKERA